MLFTALVLASLASAAGPVRPLVLAPAARSVPRLPLVLPPAALFDWDDTLADEGAVWQAVVKATSEKLGLPSPSRDLAERAWILDRPNFYGRHIRARSPPRSTGPSSS